MCMGGRQRTRTVEVPTYVPPAPAPPAPPPPPPVPPIQTAPPVSLTGAATETKVRNKTNTRDRLGIKRGTSQLKIPLNRGSSSDKSGGLNL